MPCLKVPVFSQTKERTARWLRSWAFITTSSTTKCFCSGFRTSVRMSTRIRSYCPLYVISDAPPCQFIHIVYVYAHTHICTYSLYVRYSEASQDLTCSSFPRKGPSGWLSGQCPSPHCWKRWPLICRPSDCWVVPSGPHSEHWAGAGTRPSHTHLRLLWSCLLLSPLLNPPWAALMFAVMEAVGWDTGSHRRPWAPQAWLVPWWDVSKLQEKGQGTWWGLLIIKSYFIEIWKIHMK